MIQNNTLTNSFSNLFGAPPREALAITAGGQTILSTSRNSSPVVSYHGSPAAAMTTSDQQAGSSSNQLVGPDILQQGAVRSGSSIRSINQRLSSNSDLIVLMDSDLNIDRSRAVKDGNGRINSELSGYVHAYGWSLPASSVRSLAGSASSEMVSNIGSPKRVSSILGGTSSYMATDPLALSPNDSASVSFSKQLSVQVPIPQYCRPLTGDSLGMKIWCATAIDLSGGEVNTVQKAEDSIGVSEQLSLQSRNPDSSGSIVNISTSTPIKSPNQHALRILEQEVNRALNEVEISEETASTATSSKLPILKTTTEMVLSAFPIVEDMEELSTCVWICSTQHSRSKITIIDIKTKPNELLDSFYVSTFLYCIKSVPGSKSGDLLGISGSRDKNLQKSSMTLNILNELISTQKREFYKLIEVDLEAEQKLRQSRQVTKKTLLNETAEDLSQSVDNSNDHESATNKSRANEDDAEISRILDNNISVGIATLQKLNDFVAHTQPQSQSSDSESTEQFANLSKTSPIENRDSKCHDAVYYQPISTYLPTVWMGGKDSVLYIHSAIAQWKDCVACLKLRDSILQICHYRGRVFVALADGSLCVFFRNIETKQWEFSQYLLLDINLMSEVTSDFVDITETSQEDIKLRSISSTSGAQSSSGTTNLLEQMRDSAQQPLADSASSHRSRSKVAGIRCLEIANKNLWIGYRNRVLIIDPITLKLKHTFNIVPQVDNQIRQLISMKDGVFCCLRSDLILRLYSSLKPYQHIQNIDIEPVVTRLISPKTFVVSHVTAMKVTDNTLWIGNAHGIILTIPCKLVPQISEAPSNIHSGEFNESPSGLSIARFVPKCDITNAQVRLSFSTIIQLSLLTSTLTLDISAKTDIFPWTQRRRKIFHQR